MVLLRNNSYQNFYHYMIISLISNSFQNNEKKNFCKTNKYIPLLIKIDPYNPHLISLINFYITEVIKGLISSKNPNYKIINI